MAKAVNLGMPRIGQQRELKRATEAFWAGSLDEEGLARTARAWRAESWEIQRRSGVSELPSNDFSLYDHVLDACCLVGAVPERFGFDGGEVELDTYFALARGSEHLGSPIRPLEMTKWFDTNYHYLVPELGPTSHFRVASNKPVAEFLEARSAGYLTRPVLIGPLTFLLLAKSTVADFSTLELLPELLPVYVEVLRRLQAAGATWVQIDEPCLATDLQPETAAAYASTYATLAAVPGLSLLVATYFGGLADNLDLATSLPVSGLHVDLVRDPDQLTKVAKRLRPDVVLSAGVVDGRNVWRTDLTRAIRALEPVHDELGADRLWVAPSSSLLHVPIDLDLEESQDLDLELRSWLSFASQKLREVAVLARGLSEGLGAIADELAATERALTSRRHSVRTHSNAVRARLDATSAKDLNRRTEYARRAAKREESSTRPILPTTTIGSFPQTREIRQARQRFATGRIGELEYRRFCEVEIERAIRQQEALGLDVLVHGEAERNDMVQYFADNLSGFFCTETGWVQSYGTRYIRPPIIFGDVERPVPIATQWIRYAQSLTEKPVKGMLTGPVTILQWSFVRDDQPRAETCLQIALAIRDEVSDLEAAGTKIIQVDEPALREGLPSRRVEQPAYLAWATESFRLATSGVEDETEIHTHMCYVELGDILEAVRSLDVDVISIEAARSAMSVLDDLSTVEFHAQVGPGVYDIHSPLPPSVAEITARIERALEHVPPERLWVNPDCGLKTRTWEEILPALENMVAAATAVRSRIDSSTGHVTGAAT